MESAAKTLSENLRTFREANGYTQEQIANYLGLDQTTVSKIERGTRTIGVSSLEKLASLYFCSIDTFLEAKPEPTQVAFRKTGASAADLDATAAIGRIAANLKEMTALEERLNHE